MRHAKLYPITWHRPVFRPYQRRPEPEEDPPYTGWWQFPGPDGTGWLSPQADATHSELNNHSVPLLRDLVPIPHLVALMLREFASFLK